jgi:SAM-dependent methyltransferase
MNGFLKTHQEINDCTAWLRKNGYVEHGLDCKNWDIFHVMPEIGDGNFLDMGAFGSYILYNVVKKNFKGLKYGVDLFYPDGYFMTKPGSTTQKLEGVECVKSDLMHTPFEDGLFKYITCLSVIEHEVDFSLFASECSRLLATGGKLFVTFDYWNPKVVSSISMWGLSWTILDRNDAERLISICAEKGLVLDGDVDWTIQDAVINPKYYSPDNVSYTFGMLTFIKK